MTQTEKKKIIERLVVVPKTQKRAFWGREMVSLKALQSAYPEKDFWLGLTFGQKFNTLVLLRSGHYRGELQKKYNRFKYTIPPPEDLELGVKSGNDYTPPDRPKNLREFLS